MVGGWGKNNEKHLSLSLEVDVRRNLCSSGSLGCKQSKPHQPTRGANIICWCLVRMCQFNDITGCQK